MKATSSSEISIDFQRTQEFVLCKIYIITVREKSAPPDSARPYNDLHATDLVFMFKT
jgi:hypothetical protein